jgi:hypothetical protein
MQSVAMQSAGGRTAACYQGLSLMQGADAQFSKFNFSAPSACLAKKLPAPHKKPL